VSAPKVAGIKPMTPARLALSVTLLAGVVLAAPLLAAAELAVGDRAPDFELRGSDGNLYRLRDLLAEGGSQGIVLAWFPKAFTPG
jgi:peroxiredoxin Q/BCP